MTVTTRRQRVSIVLVALFVASCASIPPNTDPQARAAYYANEAVLRIGEVQTVAIEANRNGGLSDREAVLIVRFTVSATKTIKESPNGWVPVVKQGYTELRPLVTVPIGSPVAVAIAVLDALLLKVQPNGP